MKEGREAFPHSHDVREYFGKYGRSQVCLHQSDDMTLRDYFAGQALVGLLADTRRGAAPEDYARVTYLLADGMFPEREKRNGKDNN